MLGWVTYRLRVTVPRTNKQPIESLVQPHLPTPMKPEAPRPNPNHAPPIQQNNSHGNDIKHRLRAQPKPLLDIPVRENPQRLRGNTDNQEIRQLQRIVSDDLVLQSGDDRDGGVEGVAEEEVADQVRQTLLELPDLTEGAPQLPEAGQDDVHTRVLAGAAFFEDEPGDSQYQPDRTSEGDED